MLPLAFFLLADTFWTRFGDPELPRLIEKAQRGNLDLELATRRIMEARAAAGVARSWIVPSLNLSGSAQRLRGGFQQGVTRIPQSTSAPPGGAFVAPFETPVYQSGFDMRWEIDLFGANRQRAGAAESEVKAVEWERRDLEVVITAEVALAYIEMRGWEERAAILARSRDAQREILRLTLVRADAGLASQLDVEREAARLASAEALLPPLEAGRRVRLNRLAVLTGDRDLALASATAALRLPDLPVEIDSEILRNRPDVRAADLLVAAEQARLKAARTDLYPKISLTGLMGRQATSAGGLSFGGGNFFGFGPQLHLPLFSGGRIRSGIAAQDARLAQAATRYRQEILAAFEEAANALVTYAQEQARTRSLDEAVRAASRSLALALDLHQAGLADLLAVFNAERQKLEAEDARSASATAALSQAAAVYKALRGEWK